MGFTPAISQKNIARITEVFRKLEIHRWVHFPLSRIAELLESRIRGWLNYYAKFRKSELRKLFRVVNLRLAKWVRNKYRKFRRRHWFLAYKYLQGIAKIYPNMFEHWKHGFQPWMSVFIMKSRMNREVHVRFWERFRGEIPLYLLDYQSETTSTLFHWLSAWIYTCFNL